MKVSDKIRTMVKEIEEDERYHYPPDMVKDNPDLAKVQLELKSRMDVLKILMPLTWEMENDYDKQVNKFEKQITAQKEYNKDLSRKINDTNEKLKKASDEVSEAKKNVEEKNMTVQAYIAKIEDQDKEVKRAQASELKAIKTLKNAEEKIGPFTEALNKGMERIEKLKANKKELEQNLNHVKQIHNKIEQKVLAREREGKIKYKLNSTEHFIHPDIANYIRRLEKNLRNEKEAHSRTLAHKQTLLQKTTELDIEIEEHEEVIEKQDEEITKLTQVLMARQAGKVDELASDVKTKVKELEEKK